MQLPARIAAATASVVLASLTATACAPSTADTGAKGDAKTGTLRVWLFQEVNNAPKERVVRQAVSALQGRPRGRRGRRRLHTRRHPRRSGSRPPSTTRTAPPMSSSTATPTPPGTSRTADWPTSPGSSAPGPEAEDTDATAKQSVTVDGKVYGAPLFVGVRALYYRTDVFKDLGIRVPTTQAELVAAAKKIRTGAPGALRPRGRRRVHLWRDAVHLGGRRRTRHRKGRHLPRRPRRRGGQEGHRRLHRPLRRRQLPRRQVRRHGRQRHRHRLRLGQGRHGHRRRLQPPGRRGRQGQGQVRRGAAARPDQGRASHRPSRAATTSASSTAAATAPSPSA